MSNTGSRILYNLCVGILAVLCLDAHAGDKPMPCGGDPIFQQQDFALGHWEVFEANKKTAEVNLEKVLKGCAIQETWTPLSDGDANGIADVHGAGLFMYSRLLKSWGYFWAADSGQTTTFSAGALSSPGTMLYLTEVPLKDGGKRLRHWSLNLQPDGTIRELSVATNDGRIWTTEYELLWRRKN